jgi:DNA-binding NarL/FixJ family response regulator
MDEDNIVSSIHASVKGYLVKDSKEDVIFEAIRKVAKGEMYLTPNVSEVLTKSLLQGKKNLVQKEKFNLTKREMEILQCIVDGLSNKMIAPELNIKERTVNTHRYNIMQKLNANNTADVVRIALKYKLLN